MAYWKTALPGNAGARAEDRHRTITSKDSLLAERLNGLMTNSCGMWLHHVRGYTIPILKLQNRSSNRKSVRTLVIPIRIDSPFHNHICHWQPSLLNCITLSPDRAISANGVVCGFCSSPRNLFLSKTKSICRGRLLSLPNGELLRA
jgi:hypothetical protein